VAIIFAGPPQARQSRRGGVLSMAAIISSAPGRRATAEARAFEVPRIAPWSRRRRATSK
jgi:hypothetical protein